MFEIPENLPLTLAPLAWVVGSWQGWGTRVTAEDEPDELILQDIRANIVGDHMRMVTTLYHASSETEVDPTLDAAGGLDLITAGELWREETTYWKLATPLAVVPAEDGSPRELQASSSDTDGMAILWLGVAMGPRLRLVSDVIARDASAVELENVTRMFGLVGGELMWTSEKAIGEDDPKLELSGRLHRVDND